MEMRRSALLTLVSSLGLSCSVLLDANGLQGGSDASVDAPEEATFSDVGADQAPVIATDASDGTTDSPATITDGSTFTCVGRDAHFCDNFDGVFVAAPYVDNGNGTPASSVLVDNATAVSLPNALVLASGGGPANEFRARSRNIDVPENTKELYFSGDVRTEFGLSAGETVQILSLNFESVNGLVRHQMSVRITGSDMNLSVVDQKTFDAGPFISATANHAPFTPNKWTHLTFRLNVDSGAVVVEIDGKSYSSTVSLVTKRARAVSFRSSIFSQTQAVGTKRIRFDNVVLYATP